MKKLNDHFKEILENVGIAIRESSNSKHKLNNIKLHETLQTLLRNNEILDYHIESIWGSIYILSNIYKEKDNKYYYSAKFYTSRNQNILFRIQEASLRSRNTFEYELLINTKWGNITAW